MSDTLSTPRSARRKKKRSGLGKLVMHTNADTPTSTPTSTDSPQSFSTAGSRDMDQRTPRDSGRSFSGSRSNRSLESGYRDVFSSRRDNKTRGHEVNDHRRYNDDDDEDDDKDSDEGIEVGKHRHYQQQQQQQQHLFGANSVSGTPRGRQHLARLAGNHDNHKSNKRRDDDDEDDDDDTTRVDGTPRSRARRFQNWDETKEEDAGERIRDWRSGDRSLDNERNVSRSSRERESDRLREMDSNRLRDRESDRLRERESERLRERRRSRHGEDDDLELPVVKSRSGSKLATPPRTPRFSDTNTPSPRVSKGSSSLTPIIAASSSSSMLRPLGDLSGVRNNRLVSPRVSATSLDSDLTPEVIGAISGMPLSRRFRLATINDSGSSENSEGDDDVVVSTTATAGGFRSKSAYTSGHHAEKRLHDSDGDSQRLLTKRSTNDAESFSKKNSSAQQARKAGYRISKDFTSEEDEVSDRVSKLPSTSKIRRNRNLDISFSEDDKNKSRKKLHNGSGVLNRTYEKDDFIAELRASKTNSCLDMSLNSGFKSGLTLDTMSSASTQSCSILRQLSSREARSRSYLVGSLTSGSGMLSGSELERFFPERKARVFVGTWNMCEHKFRSSSTASVKVGGVGNGSEDVDDFLLPETCELVHDIYAIGTQESCANRAEWDLKLQETLGPQHVLLHSASFGILHLSIFIRRDLIWYCSVCEDDSVSTRGGPSSVKTKGAIAICFSLFGTSMLFVNSHLAADATAKFDATFWCGDLNFRILGQRDHVHDHVNVEEGVANIALLLKQDELSMAMNDGIAFDSFQEGRIKFKPTYKFAIGTNDYENKKLRTPSYTDRVLFRSKRKHGVTCLYYDSVPSITLSDHKPVFALFEVNLRPGRDNTELSGGVFKRDVWLEANRRRSEKQDRIDTKKKSSSSAVCCVQ